MVVPIHREQLANVVLVQVAPELESVLLKPLARPVAVRSAQTVSAAANRNAAVPNAALLNSVNNVHVNKVHWYICLPAPLKG